MLKTCWFHRCNLRKSLLISFQYETNHELAPNHKFYQASDVRRQIGVAPSNPRLGRRYPGRYGNMEGLPLTSERPRLEYPVAPSPAPGQPPRNYPGYGPPGPSRLIYNRNDRESGDVIYHNPNLPAREGPRGINQPFSMATYHAGPTYAEPGSFSTEHGSSSSR